MKWTDKNNRRHLLESLLIFIIGGSINAFLACQNCFRDMSYAVPIIGYSGSMWVLLWKGNEFISCEIDKKISWIREPAKRFWAGILFMLVYTISAVIINSYIFMEFVFTEEFSLSFRTALVPVILYSISITAIIMLIFLAVQFFQGWRQTAINEEKLRRENIASQYEALKNQVNPHFLFNTLNALSSLVYEDRDKAVQFINKFSEVYRYVLDSKDKEVVPVGEEIAFVKSFIYLLQVRYEKNLKITIEDDLSDGYVPPMSVQMLVENAVKHNIIADDSPLHIGIKKNGTRILIENDIHLKNDFQESSGLGIENIKSRYSILSDQPVIVEHDDTKFSVSIPVLQLKK